MTVSVTRTVSQYRSASLEPGDDDYISDEDAAATARMMLLEQFRDNGEEMTTDPTASDPEPVIVRPDFTGWDPCPSDGFPTGHIITWTATGRPAHHDREITLGDNEQRGDGWYEASIPEHLTATGGAARVRHNLDVPGVIVSVLSADGPVGYLFAQEMSRDEVHVEFFAGAAVVHVAVDPDVTDDDDAES